MRSQDEVQRAHDMLVAIVLGELPVHVSDEAALHAAADVLCWVLQHDHNLAFADNLTRIERQAVRLGAVFERRDDPQPQFDPSRNPDVDNRRLPRNQARGRRIRW